MKTVDLGMRNLIDAEQRHVLHQRQPMLDAGLDNTQGDLVIAANEKVRRAVIGQPTSLARRRP